VEITFLGTSSGVPTLSRNVSSVALRLQQRAEIWLFDCGEATQHQFLKTDLKISQITRIFITHMHGDHIFGLMGLLATCSLAGKGQEINIYGPDGLVEYLRVCGNYSETNFSSPIKVQTIKTGTVYEDEEFIVSTGPLKHRVPAFGYRVVEKDRVGRFEVEKAEALGIPAGPLYGRLKRGEKITLPDGRIVEGKELCGPTEKGRKFAYCTDTTYCKGSIELAKEADLLIHEATFAKADEDLAKQSMHSTTLMAAQVAKEADVRRLIMTHFSPRYANGNEIEPKDLLKEARSIFPNTSLAYDLSRVEIPRNREIID
jgi:ribonuclease Z